MNLIIDNSQHKLSNRFLQFLMTQMRKYFLRSLNKEELQYYQRYLNDVDLGWVTYNSKKTIPRCYSVVVGSIYNLQYIDTGESIVIELNPNTFIPNTNAKFIDIARMINYGNLSLHAYPIYDKMFNHFAKCIGSYYNKYVQLGGT